MKKNLTFLSILVLILSLQLSAFAQEDTTSAPPSNASAQYNLAKASQNPIASLSSLPFQFNFNMGVGDYDRTQFVLNIQPVLPTKIGKNWNMINRIILPIKVQPDVNAESGSTTGLGTINYTPFFSPKPFGKVSLGFGPSLLIPVLTAPEFGDGQFAIGPSFVLFAGVGKKWTIGFVTAQNWGYYSPTDDPLHSSFFVQYFINYNMKNAWSIGSAPTITVNWNAEDGEKATVPFGLNVAKITQLGKQAAKFSLAYNYNAVNPSGGAKNGQIQFMFILLFPKK